MSLATVQLDNVWNYKEEIQEDQSGRQSANATYKVASWNLGLKRDFKDMCLLNTSLYGTSLERAKPFIISTIIAIVAIAILGSGGAAFLFLKFNAIVCYSLIGAGGLTGIVAIGAFAISGIRHGKPKMELKDAFQNMLDRNSSRDLPTKKELSHRQDLIKSSMNSLNHPDFICLQEIEELETLLKDILPQYYSFFVCRNDEGFDNLVAWDNTKFTLVAEAKIEYDVKQAKGPQLPDSMVLLKDKSNGNTVCVASSHLRGFSLANPSQNERGGDYQTAYNIVAMNQVKADLYIYTGDFNVPRNTNLLPPNKSTRITQLETDGYVFSVKAEDEASTVLDRNLKKADNSPMDVRLDHTGAKGNGSNQVTIKDLGLQGQDLYNFDRVSDHLYIMSEITVSSEQSE